MNALVADIRIGLASGHSFATIQKMFTELAEGTLEDEVASKIPDIATIKANREQYIKEQVAIMEAQAKEGGSSCSPQTFMICNTCEAVSLPLVPGETNFCGACGGNDMRVLDESKGETTAYHRALSIWCDTEDERKAEKKHKAEERKAKKTKKEVLIQ